MPDNRENREEKDRERNSIINEDPELFSHLKEREMTQNMAKLLLVSREKKMHLGDALHPSEGVRERLDKIADELALIQAGTMSSDKKIQEKYEKEWEDRTKEIRDFVINMDYERESIYALGISPKKMKRSERNAIMNDPRNVDALKKITDDISNCIKKADEFHDLSTIMVNKETWEKVPLVKERIESLDNVSLAFTMVQNLKGKESKQEEKQEEKQAEKTDPDQEITSKDLEYLKADETYTNMAKLLVMSRDNLHFADVQNPDPDIQERLDKTLDELVDIQAKTLSADEKIREAGEKAWESCTEKCRGFVMDMNYHDECLRALGMNPEEIDPARRKIVMNDPQNMDAFRKITDVMADCIEKADKYDMLSNIRADGKDEPIPNIKKQIESLREFSSVYEEAERQEKKEKSSDLNREENRQEEKHAEKKENTKPEEKREIPGENKAKSGAEQEENVSEAPSRTDRLDAARSQIAKLGGRPRPVQAPQITDVKDLPTRMSILQWIARLLGLEDLFEQTKKKELTAETKNPVNERKVSPLENIKKEQQDRQKDDSEKYVQQNRPKAKTDQEKYAGQKASGENAQKMSDLNAIYLMALQDAQREIFRLRVENMQKTNIIKFLKSQMAMAQPEKAVLDDEKTVKNEKTVKKEKAGVEKISFKELSREESNTQRKRPRMEHTLMERKPLQMSEKTKKSRESSFGK